MAAPDALLDLVRRFDDNREAYRSSHYNETRVRREFIDPFFSLLGWDIDNRQGIAPAYQDVVHEDAIKIGGAHKAPDYSFRIGGARKFFVEAKKPAINLEEDIAPAFQLRRYAWSANLPLSVLTDFEEFAVYDCRVMPTKDDRASVARTVFFTYPQYADEWDEIASIFSKDAVLGGSLDKYANRVATRRGTATVDTAFLKEIESWRDLLARDLAANNPDLNRRELNFAVQMTIDRIVFLRMTEDRGIEEYGRLQALLNGDQVYARLRDLYRQADERYNSGLFHFRTERDREEAPDELTPRLTISDDTLRQIIRHLYYPDSPYEFSVLPIEVLGRVYEQFLGKVIDLSPDRKVTIEEKPEVRKAGGVYYTPKYIVDYIVEHTVGKLLEGKRPGPRGSASKLRILDPACGSGSFLIGAYEYLLDWHRDEYVRAGPEKHRKELFQGAGGEWRLTTAEKKRILLNNIYGVDIDPQAVEVTKLSLLLKVLEGETSESLVTQLSLFRERALPDLSNNIKCGNSLIGPDFYDNQQMALFDVEEAYRVNVFDWRTEYSDIIDRGGFDAVIGNPPWLMAGYYARESLDYFRRHYRSATGKFDLYYLFIEQGCRLLAPSGQFGMIVPNKFFHTSAATALRQMLSESRMVREIVDFGYSQVFSSATNYSCILFLDERADPGLLYREADLGLDFSRELITPWAVLGGGVWHFEEASKRSLFEKLEARGAPLEDLTDRFGTGVQSGADRLLVVEERVAKSLHLEPGLLRPFLRGRDVRRYSPVKASKDLIFPYRLCGSDFAILDEVDLEAFPHALDYLNRHRSRLVQRVWFGKGPEELSGEWYGMMYLDSYRAFSSPHLLTPSLSNESNFALGTGELFATGTAGVTSVIPKSGINENLLYLLGLLNSRLMSLYAVSHSPVFSGGYYKFSAPYLKRIPVMRIDQANEMALRRHDQIVHLVEQALEVRTRLASVRDGYERAVLLRQAQAGDREIDRLIYELYDLTNDEIAIVEDRVS